MEEQSKIITAYQGTKWTYVDGLTDGVDWHPSKLHLRPAEPKSNGKQNINEDVIPGFEGTSRTDLFYASEIERCFTLETHYKFYDITRDNITYQVKLNTSDFEEIGRALVLTLLEFYNMRTSRSYFTHQARIAFSNPNSKLPGRLDRHPSVILPRVSDCSKNTKGK
jgi:hypothetical protein